jgi:hypothetical protein
MILTQLGAVVLILAIVLLPQVLAAHFSAPEVSAPEEYDYR